MSCSRFPALKNILDVTLIKNCVTLFDPDPIEARLLVLGGGKVLALLTDDG